jgi:hypothetical protein
MAAIKPFRYLIVYPALMRQIGREWRAPPRSPTQPTGAERCRTGWGLAVLGVCLGGERAELP